MHGIDQSTTSALLVIGAVVLFFLLGIAILVIMDHKARIPGGFKRDLFSVVGMRRDHPVEAFLTGTSTQITPIQEMDGIPLYNDTVGPLTRQLQDAFLKEKLAKG